MFIKYNKNVVTKRYTKKPCKKVSHVFFFLLPIYMFSSEQKKTHTTKEIGSYSNSATLHSR